jgi:hypothetical protein
MTKFRELPNNNLLLFKFAFNKMLVFLAKLLSSHSKSKQSRIMQQDTLLRLIDSSDKFQTSSFLRDIAHLAITSSGGHETVLNRFMVQSVTLCKDPPPSIPQHEFMLIELMDTQRTGMPPLLMMLERTASGLSPPPSYFTSHPNSPTILDSIVQTLKDMHALLPSSINSSTHPTLSGYENASEESDSRTSTLPLSPSLYQLPFLDAASLTSAKAIHFVSPSISPVYRAEDCFVGGKNIGFYLQSAHNIRQIRPSSFSLFDLVVLADAVHNHDPLYSLLSSHCYWYANIICDVIVKKYLCTTTANERLALSADHIHLPANNYLPDLAGTWMGILVSRVGEAVSSVVASNFEKYLQEKTDEVRFHL